MSSTRADVQSIYEHLEISFHMTRIAKAEPGTDAGVNALAILQQSLVEISKSALHIQEVVQELEVRPFRCKICLQGFATRQGRSRHVKSQHGEVLSVQQARVHEWVAAQARGVAGDTETETEAESVGV